MKKASLATLLVFSAAVLFPPADLVRPATQGHRIGDSTIPGTPELRRNKGFTFIAAVGGPVQIRFAQWLVQIGAVALVGGFVVVSTAKPKP